MNLHDRPFRFVPAPGGASDLVVVSAAEYWHRNQGWPNSLALEALAQGCIRSLGDTDSRAPGLSPPRDGVPVLVGFDDAVFASAALAAGRYRVSCTVEARVGELIKTRARLEEDGGRAVAAATLWVSWQPKEKGA